MYSHTYFTFRFLNNYRPTDHVKVQHVDELLNMMASITHDDRFLLILYDKEGGKPGEHKEFDEECRLDHPAGYGCPGNTKIGAIQVRCKAVNRVRSLIAPVLQFQ